MESRIELDEEQAVTMEIRFFGASYRAPCDKPKQRETGHQEPEVGGAYSSDEPW